MIKKITLTLFLCAFAFLTQIKAQTTIPDEKQAALKELIALINENHKAGDIVALLSRQMESSRVAAVKSMLDERGDLTAADRQALEKSLIDDAGKTLARFQEKLMQKLDYENTMKEIVIAVYDKYYSLEEIKDLLAFYKTPTGQKTLKQMMPLMTDTMQRVQTILLPKIPVVIRELQEEDRQDIEKQINTRKPRPDKPTA